MKTEWNEEEIRAAVKVAVRKVNWQASIETVEGVSEAAIAELTKPAIQRPPVGYPVEWRWNDDDDGWRLGYVREAGVATRSGAEETASKAWSKIEWRYIPPLKWSEDPQADIYAYYDTGASGFSYRGWKSVGGTTLSGTVIHILTKDEFEGMRHD